MPPLELSLAAKQCKCPVSPTRAASHLVGLDGRLCGATELPPAHIIFAAGEAGSNQGHMERMHLRMSPAGHQAAV